MLPASPTAGPAMDADRVYVPVAKARLVALHRTNGQQAWMREIEIAVPPAISGASVWVATATAIHELDGTTGRSKRSVALPASPAGPITVAGDILIVPIIDGTLVAIGAGDGLVRWHRPLASAARHTAAVLADTAFFALADSRVVALALDDGRVRWSRPLNGALSPPVATGERLFVGSDDGTLYTLATRSGDRAWSWTAGGDVVGAAVDGRNVYVVSLDNVIRALDQGSGRLQWQKGIQMRPVAPPRIFGTLLMVAGVKPPLAAFELATGMAAGTFALDAALKGLLYSAPLVGERTSPVPVVLLMRDGQVLGLKAAAPATSENGVRSDAR